MTAYLFCSIKNVQAKNVI